MDNIVIDSDVYTSFEIVVNPTAVCGEKHE